ncbi:MAG: hypothetical protein Q4A92_05605 [Corynebacterium sp.]|nr:hypothetical protein [Corynebacterium sp.]
MITLRHFTQSPMNTNNIQRQVQKLRSHQPSTLQRAAGIIAHPRSLSRTTPTWRPPSIHLPSATTPKEPALVLTITRHRIDAHAKSTLRAWDPTTSLLHVPAFILTFRITSRDGAQVHHHVAESWVRAILPELSESTLHQHVDASAPTFSIVLDGRFHPLPSPAALFADSNAA